MLTKENILFGNTLTKRLKEGLDKIGLCTETDEDLKRYS